MIDVLKLLKELPNQTDLGRDWLGRADAARQYPYYGRVFAALDPWSILEIGTYLGYSLATAAAILPNLKWAEWVDDESYLPGSNRMAAENIHWARKEAGFGHLLTGSTKCFGEYFYDLPSPDLVHIDGSHSFEGCCADIAIGYGTGAYYLLGHDYELEQGVKRAVKEFCDEHSLVHLSLPDFTHGLWLISCSNDWKGAVEKLLNAGVGPVLIHPAGKG